VYGDTNSTLAGAEAAAERDVPVAHVEAGLRSGDWAMPEERNRVAVDRIARLLLCPDERSSEQLAAEAVTGRREVVGDVMYDATLRLAPIARRRSTIVEHLGVRPGEHVVATIHRQANVEPGRLQRIVAGLARVDRHVVFPAHPRTMQALIDARIDVPPEIDLVKPLGYLDMSALVASAHALVTDSGGLQKEAYWLGVPCVTTRPSTEWVDTVRTGANVLVDDDPDLLAEAVRRAELPEDRPELYGDGRASERIAAALASSLSPA
jgi:UDP-N-acetylglucosamine 2-epimerase